MGNTEVKRKAIPKKIRKRVYEKYNGHCAYCGCEMELSEMQVDHMESLYWHGGADDISNYMPACRACNFYKSTFPIEEFRRNLMTMPERLEKEFIYRLSKKYGIIEETDNQIEFYFETVNTSIGGVKTMNRITQYSGGVPVIPHSRIKDAAARLSGYEDTGLTPEEIVDGKLLTGWILVEERSPDESQEVLATDGEYVYLVEYDSDYGYGDEDGMIAWMPLPEPYKPD